ncbi:MAG: hypothetical protein JNL28_05710 [Planctomycetes bacterium]|nr:hypothetical protein [Planctomycetota bacterium]
MPEKLPNRPFGHFRLTAFFVLVALLGVVFALWRVRAHQGVFTASDVIWISATSVAFSVSTGFAGVFFHRLRINPVRWRETENYLVAIRRESTKYRALMEAAADSILVVDPRARVVREASRRARTEFALADQASPPVAACFATADHERFFDALERAARAGGVGITIEGLTPAGVSGPPRVFDARLASVDLDGECLVQVALRDVTQQMEMERSLVVHERLSSIGLLTAGVAHEINNPLEGIGNYLKLLERPDLPPESRERYLGLVRHGFARIGEIVRDLLHFARAEPGSGTADFSAVVERAVKLAGYSAKLRGVLIETAGLDAPLLVRGDAGRLEQVVVNLLINAGVAMQQQGRIRLAAQRDENGWLVFTVDDEGPGIPPADLTRIFDPFFTKTEGTGLGLFVSYGIVAAHGGRIRAENRSGGGARFTLVLPADETESEGN